MPDDHEAEGPRQAPRYARSTGSAALTSRHVQKKLHVMEPIPEEPAPAVDEIMSARERQVMEALYRRGQATASEIFDDLPDAASYNAVRGVLRILEEKGHAHHVRDGRRYVYRPSTPAEAAGRSRLVRLARTFFGGSAERVMSALFDEDPPDPEQLDRIEELIGRARRQREEGGR